MEPFSLADQDNAQKALTGPICDQVMSIPEGTIICDVVIRDVNRTGMALIISAELSDYREHDVHKSKKWANISRNQRSSVFSIDVNLLRDTPSWGQSSGPSGFGQDLKYTGDCLYVELMDGKTDAWIWQALNEPHFEPNCDPFERPAIVKLPASKSVISIVNRYDRGVLGNSGFVGGNFWRMLYFSTITIATIGYGDIIPITPMARILVGSEAFLGLIFAGLFLSSLYDRVKPSVQDGDERPDASIRQSGDRR
jgi:hypothetical protein